MIDTVRKPKTFSTDGIVESNTEVVTKDGDIIASAVIATLEDRITELEVELKEIIEFSDNKSDRIANLERTVFDLQNQLKNSDKSNRSLGFKSALNNAGKSNMSKILVDFGLTSEDVLMIDEMEDKIVIVTTDGRKFIVER